MESQRFIDGSRHAPLGLGWFSRLCRDPVAWLIAGVTLARVAYLLWLCPYELVEDEAHYWEWSRRLGLSYYSKGPGVAWAIALSTWVLGTSEAAVRMPSVVASAVSTAAVAALARDVSGFRRAGFVAACLFNLAPVFQFTSLLMTIDSPYIACWSVAAWAGWRARSGPGPVAAWGALLGAAVGAGFLFKYTVLLIIPGIVVGWWWSARLGRGHAPPARRVTIGGCLAAMAAFAALSWPVAVWNARQGWPTVRHLLGHLGVRGGDVPVPQAGSGGWSYNPVWTLELVGLQALLLGAVTAVIVGSVAWFMTRGRRTTMGPGGAYLVGCAAPVLVFYLGVTFFTRAEGNWPMAAFPTLLALAGAWILVERGVPGAARSQAPGPRGSRGFAESSWRASVWAGIIFGVLMLRADLLARIPLIGPAIPLGRLLGGREQARHVDELTSQLRRVTGLEPMVVIQHYGQASRVAFYRAGREVVFCASSLNSGRRTQYDYWPDTDLHDAALLGRPGVLIGGLEGQWRRAFERVELIGQVRGESKKDRQAFLGFGYKGYGSSGAGG
ncbi:MAG: glycosyltransferase family 39 protein [Phycisphaeraceae bacterium]|nr:glycosyltransferase family 39 protein [Phycisphaerae bacterium]MBX3392679.1 glycosyltransferase family 39 protein [Phycisphaeraceae bacterium]